MNAREWTEWFVNNRAWAARKGSRIVKLALSADKEMDWDRAYLDDVLGEHGLTLNSKAVAHLCGVPLMFTSKLPNGRCMWVLKDINNSKPIGPAEDSQEAA